MQLILAESAIDGLKDLINRLSQPEPFFILSVIGLIAFLAAYKFFTKPMVALAIGGAGALFYIASAFDSNFRSIITKPDNVPITLLMITVGFFTWLAFRQASVNDTNIAQGKPLIESGADDKVLVWPDLVYTELIAMVLCTVLLTVWGVVLRAPLEQPADPSVAPNPAKAPWYFLGLQELLVYFDPWIAGVLLPGLIIVGLAAIPYMDRNPRGNGYYTFKERPFAISTFMFGWMILWVVLIVFGTFLRGPNWNFFGPYEYWDAHAQVALLNLEPSDIFWVKLLGQGVPTPEKYGEWHFLIRELPGLLLMGGYFFGTPVLAMFLFRKTYEEMGAIRFFLMVILMLWMLLVPIKMVLRWMFNLHYIVGITEWFFNI